MWDVAGALRRAIPAPEEGDEGVRSDGHVGIENIELT